MVNSNVGRVFPAGLEAECFWIAFLIEGHLVEILFANIAEIFT
jgi:hypothetical protein